MIHAVYDVLRREQHRTVLQSVQRERENVHVGEAEGRATCRDKEQVVAPLRRRNNRQRRGWHRVRWGVVLQRWVQNIRCAEAGREPLHCRF